MPMHKIFLSAVSGQFKTCREELRSDLSAMGAEVVVQEDFTQHGGTLLEELEGLSLVNWEDDNQSFAVHRLVQEITRTRLEDSQREASLQTAINLIEDTLPEASPLDVRSWPIWDPLRPHIQQLVQLADQADIGNSTARLLNQLGLYFYQKGLFLEAEPLMQRALAIDEASFGSEHPNVTRHLNNLAQLLQDTNRL
jgi:hypothetical protein